MCTDLQCRGKWGLAGVEIHATTPQSRKKKFQQFARFSLPFSFNFDPCSNKQLLS
jgi:hypothetical protein